MQALEKVKDLVSTPSISSYGPDDGIPELKAALMKKVFFMTQLRCTVSYGV